MESRGTALEVGQFAEFIAAVIRQLPRDMDPDVMQGWIENQSSLQNVLRGALLPSKPRPSHFFYDKTKEGWELIENTETLEIPISNLEIVSFLRGGEEDRIFGETLRQRAKKLGANLGQGDAEYLLQNKDRIPKKWKEYFLVFPGTVWCDLRGDLHVPYLDWNGCQWSLCFGWLGGNWFSSARLLCRK